MGEHRWWDIDWRWLTRRRCRAIAAQERTIAGIQVMLCNRRRWHRGQCRG